eukprot:scaffold144912_cov19-Tisochrysis_lutea.AAC.1
MVPMAPSMYAMRCLNSCSKRGSTCSRAMGICCCFGCAVSSTGCSTGVGGGDGTTSDSILAGPWSDTAPGSVGAAELDAVGAGCSGAGASLAASSSSSSSFFGCPPWAAWRAAAQEIHRDMGQKPQCTTNQGVLAETLACMRVYQGASVPSAPVAAMFCCCSCSFVWGFLTRNRAACKHRQQEQKLVSGVCCDGGLHGRTPRKGDVCACESSHCGGCGAEITYYRERSGGGQDRRHAA